MHKQNIHKIKVIFSRSVNLLEAIIFIKTKIARKRRAMAVASDEIYFISPIENYPLYKCRSSKLDDTFLIKLPIESSSIYY